MGVSGTRPALRVRILALAGASASVALGLLAGGDVAGGAKAPPPAEIGVEVVSTSQANIVDKGRLRIEVTAPTAPMDFRAKASTADADGRARITDVRQARTKTTSPRRIRLPL